MSMQRLKSDICKSCCNNQEYNKVWPASVHKCTLRWKLLACDQVHDDSAWRVQVTPESTKIVNYTKCNPLTLTVSFSMAI